MIEIVLNFVWLVIAFAVSAAFLPRNRGRITAAVAVACLIALLFPIVSISDDFSPARDAVEECGGVRRCLLSPAHCPFSIARLPAAELTATHAAAYALALVAAGTIETAEAGVRSLVLFSRANPRSPPAA